MAKSNYTNVFFDFDGTLFDSINSMYRAYLSILESYNIKGTRAEFEKLNGPSILEISEYFKESYNIQDSVSMIFEKYKNIIEREYLKSEPFEDANEVLAELTKVGLKLSLVTSSQKSLCRPLLEKYSWNNYFISFVYGEEVKQSKPSPEIYELAYQKIGVSKDKILVVEDSLNGVNSASTAGLNVFGLNHEFSKKQLILAGAKDVFSSLSEVQSQLI